MFLNEISMDLLNGRTTRRLIWSVVDAEAMSPRISVIGLRLCGQWGRSPTSAGEHTFPPEGRHASDTAQRLVQRAALLQVALGFSDGSIKTESHQPVLSRHRRATEVWIPVARQPSHTKQSWPFEPSRCMKMTRRSPDEQLRTAADCLRRLRGLRPDPMSIPRERHNIGDKPRVKLNGTTPNREVIFRYAITGIEIFRNVKFQAPNSNKIPNVNIQ